MTQCFDAQVCSSWRKHECFEGATIENALESDPLRDKILITYGAIKPKKHMAVWPLCPKVHISNKQRNCQPVNSVHLQAHALKASGPTTCV
jgi:hypothetical protein